MRAFVQLFARLLLVGALAVALAACGSARADEPSPAPTADPGASAPAGNVVPIAAKDLRFTSSTVTAPANTPFQIAFQNGDSAPHNVAVFRDSSAAERISIGEIFGGPATKVQDVPALAAGEYFIRCDVHPDMVGTLVVR